MGFHRAFTAALRRLGRALGPRGVAACGALAVLAHPPQASGAELAPEAAATHSVETTVDKTVALRAFGPVSRVVVSQPDLVEVGASGPDALHLIGLRVGSTNLLVYDGQGRLRQTVDVRIGYDTQGLRDTLAAALPDEPISVTGLSSGVVIAGEVSTPGAAAVALELAEKTAPKGVISRLHIRDNQVRLDVRIVETSARGLKAISSSGVISDGQVGAGLGGPLIDDAAPHALLATVGGAGRYDLTTLLRLLEDKGQLKVVAQPTLVTLSGETATFRAGGELPYPVPGANGQISVQFHAYGAGLKARPVIQENGLIQVELEAELSEVDPATGLRFAGVDIAGLSTRRASTTADLRDGESYVIAGLFEHDRRRTVRRLPLLGAIPIVGSLISAAQARNQHRQLAIIVTPHIGAQAPTTLAARARNLDPKPPPAAKSAAAPLRVLSRGIRQALAPPIRWAKRAFAGANRAAASRTPASA